MTRQLADQIKSIFDNESVTRVKCEANCWTAKGAARQWSQAQQEFYKRALWTIEMLWQDNQTEPYVCKLQWNYYFKFSAKDGLQATELWSVLGLSQDCRESWESFSFSSVQAVKPKNRWLFFRLHLHWLDSLSFICGSVTVCVDFDQYNFWRSLSFALGESNSSF